VDAKYIPAIIIDNAIINEDVGSSLKIISDNPTPINGDTA